MANKADGGPAFPTHDADSTGDPRNRILTGGMTLRDWVAGQCIAAAFGAAEPLKVADDQSVESALRDHWDGVAGAAYIAADAMLDARRPKPTVDSIPCLDCGACPCTCEPF